MGNVNQEDDAVGMFLIAVVITGVFCCYWKSQQLITCLLFALPQFALGLMNDFGYSYLTVPEDAL